MLFDDRLVTVLRQRAGGELATKTQYRQLIDLLGSASRAVDPILRDAAFVKLTELGDAVPASQQAEILREPGTRLRDPALIMWLAQRAPKVAASAMAGARLTEAEWLNIIPSLPVIARGFLRHRQDLSENARHVLAQLGVEDLLLPEPDMQLAPSSQQADSTVGATDSSKVGEASEADDTPAQTGDDPRNRVRRPHASQPVSSLIERIEAVRQQRAMAQTDAAAATPVHQPPEATAAPSSELNAFTVPLSFIACTDRDGRIEAATPMNIAPLLFGLTFSSQNENAPASLPDAAIMAMRLRQPLCDAALTLDGLGQLDGIWLLQGAPLFDSQDGQFRGYSLRATRLSDAACAARFDGSAKVQTDHPSDRMRQILHELRTPVNAIQGFAEIIQQQLFGPAPNEYRALSAAIAVDAARLMAGFDELDRLARLETGALELTEGNCDLPHIIENMLHRLTGALRPRNARIVLLGDRDDVLIPHSASDVIGMIWRILATLAGTMAPAESLQITLEKQIDTVRISIELPLAIIDKGDIFEAAQPAKAPSLSAGMFGTGFSIRLARAEAKAMGGSLRQQDNQLWVTLPRLTENPSHNSTQEEQSKHTA
ncbi:sensor histidine kinase [Altericroceibacterium endophyticum]|uniref:histidine kinase n=1 Tax=Altericroceibacterium endophyticum TaxID=1808508 RepID=A0A6I4T427_9SPHN|nr:HAMP domain-containing histidine kinase [Altericroceibacterium endophyticum]MXO64295.1 hypothetical protein [Altericroceibacterium endophyticum]